MISARPMFIAATRLLGLLVLTVSFHATFLMAGLTFLMAGPAVAAPAGDLSLWYNQPAQAWTDALPVGNGKIGAMVFGGTDTARWQLNEGTLYSGGPHSYAHPGAAKYLPQIRELLFAGKQKEAEALAQEHFMSAPLRQPSYQPLGDLLITYDYQATEKGQATDYQRSLNLDTAQTTTRYHRNGVDYTQQTFVSYPDGVMVIHLTSSQPGKLNFAAQLTTPHPNAQKSASDKQTLLMTGNLGDITNRNGTVYKGQMRYATHLRVLSTDGQTTLAGSSANDTQLQVKGASHATLLLSAASSFVNFRDISADPAARSSATLQAATTHSLAQLTERHVADHQRLFRRVTLTLENSGKGHSGKGRSTSQKANSLPTDDRIAAVDSKPDPGLSALFFHYGRYLMIASSRPGGQPSNLQGLWNNETNPPWGSRYTVNINTEMNYWLTDPCNLAECAEPLYAVMSEIAESGSETARLHYDAPGWVLHHNFDLWRATAPINNANHGIWPTGGAWLCQHLWLRYSYSGDEQFLRETAYPIMKGASQFFVATLVEDPRTNDGTLISGPSNSPEHGGLVMGPTMDHQIIRHLLATTLKASEILQVDADLREKLRTTLEHIAPNHIGQHGQLQEWLEDVDRPNDKHRHVSHLWGLHPGNEISPDTPELFAAARQTLEFRGDGGTGWSRAWKINFWARLRDGDRAAKVLGGLLTLTTSPKTKYKGGGVYANLFDAHPPFQIDGNFGATAGMCEMFVQSHRRTAEGKRLVEILPALPSVWADGQVTGLRTRDGFSVDLRWKAGKLVECQITSLLGKPALLQYGQVQIPLTLKKGETLSLDSHLLSK